MPNFSLPSSRVCVWPVAASVVTGFFFAASVRETMRKHLTGNIKSGPSLRDSPCNATRRTASQCIAIIPLSP